MWLIRIDPDTGLVLDDPSNDGWMGIKEFRELVEKHKVEGLTVVALACDYLSPIVLSYQEKDRPGRAQEEVYEHRDYLKYDTDKVIQSAVSKYKELQFNAGMERDLLNKGIEDDLTKKLSTAFSEGDDVSIDTLNRRLSKFQETKKMFQEKFDRDKTISDHSVASNGYSLTRIEVDLNTRKNSKFLNSGTNAINPNKLGLDYSDEKEKVVKEEDLKKVVSSGKRKGRRGRPPKNK